MRTRRGLLATTVVAIGAIAALTLAGCSSTNPLSSQQGHSAAKKGGAIVVGSAAFPENEIVAEIYAQALKGAGVKASTHLDIGQRDAYLKALKEGSIDLVPEYSGNLLQFYKGDSTAKSSSDVYAALNDALPKGMEVLDQSAAQDRDSYNVTKKFSDEHGVTSIADLAGLHGPVVVGGNPELAQRPYGIPGLKKDYGVTATLKAISDSGGPLTVKALKDGDVQVADIFTTSPAITQFVTLKDPKNMIVAQNVVPLIRTSSVTTTVKVTLDKVSSKLTTADLIAMNAKSSGSAKESPSQIASEWLKEKGLD